jgi:8-oxo-dGTP diphosphatase
LNITKNNGFEFLEFIRITEEELYSFQPIAGSFAVIKCEGKYLMCYNTWRNQWEIPAGKREDDETPKECAVRELYEEIGQKIKDLSFKGLIKVKNLENGRIKYNPIYLKTIDELQPFIENEETSKIMLWNLNEQIGFIDEVDLKVLAFV